MRDIVDRLEAFLTALPKHSDELKKVKLRLAHKDLQFANMLYDISSGRISAILDWEFSSVVPFTKWNPRRSFPWNGQDNEESTIEKQRLLGLFEQRCKERNVAVLENVAFVSSLQESMQAVPTCDCRGCTKGPEEEPCAKLEGYSAGEYSSLCRLAFLQINTMMRGIVFPRNSCVAAANQFLGSIVSRMEERQGARLPMLSSLAFLSTFPTSISSSVFVYKMMAFHGHEQK